MTTAYYLMKISKSKGFNHLKYYTEKLQNLPIIKTNTNVCRICLNESNVSVCSENESCNLIETLKMFEILIDNNDNFPLYLCNLCVNFINTAFFFSKLAKQADKVLRQVNKEAQADLLDQLLPSPTPSDDNSHGSYQSVMELKEENQFETTTKVKRLKTASKVTCDFCNKVINKSYYKEHITMHDPNHKNYVCDVCGKSFRLRCAYHNHSLRHRTDFPYKCHLCPYRGRYAELLKNHMKTHNADYRYMCTECPARFIFKSNLNSHMLKHKVPQFKCSACNRAFHTKLALDRHHEADHMGIKNHVCNICGKAFGYRNAMMKHQRHVHKRQKSMFGRMPSYLTSENKHPS